MSRSTEYKKMDELYETCCVLMEELGMKMAQLHIMILKLGKPETQRLEYNNNGQVDFQKPQGLDIPDAREILRFTCDTLSQRVDEVVSKRRYRELTDTRYVAIRLIKQMHGDLITLQELGRIMGGRDHSTILHAISEGEELFSTDIEFRNKYLMCELALKSKFNQLLNHKNQ